MRIGAELEVALFVRLAKYNMFINAVFTAFLIRAVVTAFTKMLYLQPKNAIYLVLF